MIGKSGFWPSIGGDRKYGFEWLAAFIGSLLNNGVYNGEYAVQADTGMNVRVAAGRAWINGYFRKDSTATVLRIANADGVYPRYDRVAIRWSIADRDISLVVLKGAPALSPIAPAPTRNAEIYELILAEIRLPAGVTSVMGSMIYDKRLDTALCGITVGPLNRVDTDSLRIQLDAAYAEYMAHAQQYESAQQSQFTAWLTAFKASANAFFAACDAEWDALIAGDTSAWNTFMTRTGAEWDTMLQANKDQWNAMLTSSSTEWDGYMTGTSTEWDAWFAEVQASLTEDAAGQLFNLINTHKSDAAKHITAAERSAWNAKETTPGAQDKANAVQSNLNAHTADTTKHITSAERSAWNSRVDKSSIVSVTLTASKWAGAGPYTLTVAVAGATAANVNELLPGVGITDAQLEALRAADITDGGQAANSVTLKARGDKPTVNLPVIFIARRDL